MKTNKSKPEIEYELKLTKKILERIIELNRDKELIMPDDYELDKMEQVLQSELESYYPKYKINKK